MSLYTVSLYAMSFYAASLYTMSLYAVSLYTAGLYAVSRYSVSLYTARRNGSLRNKSLRSEPLCSESLRSESPRSKSLPLWVINIVRGREGTFPWVVRPLVMSIWTDVLASPLFWLRAFLGRGRVCFPLVHFFVLFLQFVEQVLLVTTLLV